MHIIFLVQKNIMGRANRFATMNSNKACNHFMHVWISIGCFYFKLIEFEFVYIVDLNTHKRRKLSFVTLIFNLNKNYMYTKYI